MKLRFRSWRAGKPVKVGRRTSVEALEGRALLSALTPDEAFGTGGRVAVDVFGRSDQANAVAVQPDGRILLGGHGYGAEGWHGVLVRLNPDGSRDSTFGDNGLVQAEPFDIINSLALTPEGNILVGGDAWVSDTRTAQATLARYTADGTLDTSFGAGGAGFTRVHVGSFFESVDRIAIAPDGKIVGLTAANQVIGFDQGDFGVLRFNADGTPDTTFGGGDALATTDFSDALHTEDIAYAIAFGADGKLIVGGGTVDHGGNDLNPRDGGFALARYNDDGSLDATFGDGGKAFTPFTEPNPSTLIFGRGYVHDLVVTPGGKLLAVGTSSEAGLTLARYDPNGSLDATFGDAGVRRYPIGSISLGRWDAQPLADGNLAVSFAASAPEAAVLTVDGDLVETVTRYQLSAEASPLATAFQHDGKLILSGRGSLDQPNWQDVGGWLETTDLTAWQFETGFQSDFSGPPAPPPPAPEPAPGEPTNPEPPAPTDPAPGPEPEPAPPAEPAPGEPAPAPPPPPQPTDPVPPPGPPPAPPTPTPEVPPEAGPPPAPTFPEVAAAQDVTDPAAVQVEVRGKPLVRGGKSYKLKATFSGTNLDAAAVDDVLVTGPSGYRSAAELLKAKANKAGTRVTATYRVRPARGAWDSADVGTFTVTLLPADVSPAERDAATPPGRVLTTFRVESDRPVPPGLIDTIPDPAERPDDGQLFEGPVPGEFIVGFAHRPPSTRPDGTTDLGIDFVGPSFEDPALQAKFDALGLGIRIDHFLGVRHQVLIKVRLDVTLEQLRAALARLDGMSYVEQNAYVHNVLPVQPLAP